MAKRLETSKVPLSSQISNERIAFVCKGRGLEENIGSVSIPPWIVHNGGLATYEQWITLFEHEEDDEYDGEMGTNDDEKPMIKIRFEICQETVSSANTNTAASTVTTSNKNMTGNTAVTTHTTTTTTTTSQLRNGA